MNCDRYRFLVDGQRRTVWATDSGDAWDRIEQRFPDADVITPCDDHGNEIDVEWLSES